MNSASSVRLAAIIPAYRPSEGLVQLVRTLSAGSFAAIVVVDDGSGPSYGAIFDEVALFPKVHLLRHAVNLGKGAALKAAFNYALCTFPELIGVVTADADGQHHPEDIEKVAAALEARPRSLVLGARAFAGEVPLRSRIGNVATRGIVHMLLGRRIGDTQTGLRGIPVTLLAHLMRLDARGYEFELEMLIAAHRMGIPILEEPIRTIYEEGNKSSHFNPIVDSMKIYFVLLRFGAVSFLSAALDNLVYILVYHRLGYVLPSQVLGRVVSVCFNYWVVRRSVFGSHEKHQAALPKYLALVLASGTASYAGITFLHSRFGISPVTAKLGVETLLFFVNFAVQRLFIFQPETEDEERLAVGPIVFSLLGPVALIGLSAVEVYGFASNHLFAQEIWQPVGWTRFLRFGGVFLALALPILLMFPWAFAATITLLVLGLTVFALGPVPIAGVALLLISACALGRLLMDRGSDDSGPAESGQDDLLATVAGVAAYILAMYAVVRTPFNYPAVWAAALALPILADWRGVLRRLARWTRVVTGTELRRGAMRAPFGLLAFVLMAHWLIVLKPEVGADALSTHLAVASDIAVHHGLTLEPARFTWSVMPMGGDFAYSIAYLLGGGEFGSRLLDFALLLLMTGLLYRTMRRFTSPTLSLLLAALFATTPMVQLLTGSLFVENVQAALLFAMMVALWRFDDTARRRYLNLAMLLGGAAACVKYGSFTFILIAIPFAVLLMVRHRKAMGTRPALTGALAILLLLAAAAPPYAIAYAKTGNPLFPFANSTIRSPLLDRSVAIIDYRFMQPLSWHTLYDLTFRTTLFYEGQKGSIGFQYLIFAPLVLVGIGALRSPAARSAAAVAWLASAAVLLSTPNARYLYPALPVVMAASAAALAWLLNNQPWMGRLMIAISIVCIALNLYFLPSGGYWHKDFCMRSPFSALERHRYIHENAPMREVIAWFNTRYPNAPVLLGDDSTIAGLTGVIYENHWHQYAVWDRLSHARNVAESMRLLNSWKVEHIILHKPVPGERGTPVMDRLAADCGSLQFESGDVYLVQLKPDCPGGPALPANFVAPLGSYDDFDPALHFTGEWLHDENFREPERHTISYTDATGAEFSFAFNGRAIIYKFTKAPNRGIAAVFIDGKSRDTIDLYSKQIEWQTTKEFCCFAPGRHVLTVRVTGEANPRSTGRYVDVDSLIVE